jgi:dynein heavy chain
VQSLICNFIIIFQDVVLMRALRDMNLPKFVFEDVPLFLGLIGDLFPGLDCPRVRYPNFNDAVEEVLEEGGYILLPQQVWNFTLHFLT